MNPLIACPSFSGNLSLEGWVIGLTNMVLYYSNHVEVRATPADFQFVFSHLTVERPDKEDGPRFVNAQNPVMISVSPQLAKKLLDILPGTVEGYERLFGEIQLLPTIDSPCDDE